MMNSYASHGLAKKRHTLNIDAPNVEWTVDEMQPQILFHGLHLAEVEAKTPLVDIDNISLPDCVSISSEVTNDSRFTNNKLAENRYNQALDYVADAMAAVTPKSRIAKG